MQIIIGGSEELHTAGTAMQSYMEHSGLTADISTRYRSNLEHCLQSLHAKAARGLEHHGITVELSVDENSLVASIVNRGAPVFGLPEEFRALPDADVYFQNRGRLGQVIQCKFPLPTPCQVVTCATSAPVTESDEELTIRSLERGEESQLSKLFYEVYGYQYVNEAVYFPERLAEKIASGELIPMVGVTDAGAIVAHVALVRRNQEPLVYEAGLGISSPRYKSRGVFKGIFELLMKQAETVGATFSVFDCVCNHEYSQKLTHRFGAIDTAIFVGCQSSVTQAKLQRLGIGDDCLEMDRYSLVYQLAIHKRSAFPDRIQLPPSLGERLESVLEELGLSWLPTPRFSAVDTEGAFSTMHDAEQQSVHFNLFRPGVQSVRRLLQEWDGFLQNGYCYGSVDIPIRREGVGIIHDLLAQHGFFISGLIAYRDTCDFAVRLQAIAPKKVAFDAIRLHSEGGKRLLATIREDYERTRRR